MTIHCAAVFEKGVLRPKQPMALPEGAEVELSVEYAQPAERPKSIAEALAAIAALPMEGVDDGFSGTDHDKPPRTPAQMLAVVAALPREGDGDTTTSQDHDRVLYGEKGTR